MVTFIIGLAILFVGAASTESFVRECLARMTERLQRYKTRRHRLCSDARMEEQSD